MNTLDMMELMSSWPTISRHEHGALVHTHCMLPSGSTINVFVQPTVDGFIATDRGAAFSEARANGVSPERFVKTVKSNIEARGLRLDNGKIWSPKVQRDEVPTATILVANVSRDIAEYLISQPRGDRPPISDLVPAILARRYGASVIIGGKRFRGKSEKLYTFYNVVLLSNGDSAYFDTVNRHPNSINARVVANLDISAAKPEKLQQHIIFDDRDLWSPEDISVLKTSGAKTVPFSQTELYLEKLVA